MITMFDNLSKNLSDLIRRITTGTTIDKAAVEAVLQDLKKILLQSDVDIKLTDELANNIRKKCLEQKIPAGLTLREHVLKVIYEELVRLLGEQPAGLAGKKRIMLVGLFGSGKCVHPDSLIPLNDGRILTASEFYDEFSSNTNKIYDGVNEVIDVSNKNIFVPSFNFKSMKIESKKLTHLWKLNGKELLQVYLDNGNDFSVKVTPEHPFFILRMGELKQLRADELCQDDFVAIPRVYNISGSFCDILPQLKKLDLEVKNDRNELTGDKTIKELCKELPFKKNYCVLTTKMKNKILPISLVNNKSPYLLLKYKNCKNFISFPRHLTIELAEFLGYVFGDGHLGKNTVEIVSENSEIIERVKLLSKILFGLETKTERDLRTKAMYSLRINSKTLVIIINKVFGIPVGQKGKNLSIPRQIFQSNLDVIAKFIRAYFDCDASVTKNIREIELSSESNVAIKQIQLLLLRFGMISTVSKKVINDTYYWRLHIRSRYAEVYAQKIGFEIRKKDDITKNYFYIGILQGCGKQDMIPLGRVLIESRMALGFSIGEIQECINSYGNYERKGFISRDSLFKLCRLYREKRIGFIFKILSSIKNGNLYQEFSCQAINGSVQKLIEYGMINKNGNTISITNKGLSLLKNHNRLQKLNYLELLATSDICWSSVNKIEKCKKIPTFVYDFTVEENHSFIADGVIVHNTTTAAKLAKYFLKQGLKPALVTCDFHRPAALEQLTQLGKQINVPVFYEKDPLTTAKNSLDKFRNYDTVIYDTAGRNALDKELAEELKNLGEIVKPDEVLLVIPADLGKVARVQSEEFHKLVGVTGVIITKMDGTAKAGGALATTSVTKAKAKFIGTGEKVENFELYDPERFVSRLLGLGDLQTLLEKAKEADIKKESVEKIVEGKFTLQDFYEQIESMGKMGSFKQIASMIPGMGMMKLPENIMETQEGKMKKFKYIIQSLTPKERENPEIIDSSRIKRCAKGAGVPESEVRDLLKQYEQLKKVTKLFKGRGQKDIMKLLKNIPGL